MYLFNRLSATAMLFFLASIVWAQYPGTGTFNKITSLTDVTNGYYVVAYSTTQAMNNTNSGYFGNTSISPAGTVITNPSASIVWKIETNGGGRTIYNESSDTYVSYTGSSNAAQAVAVVSSDNQRWTFGYSGSAFTVTNMAVTGRRLQYNAGSPRFACYTSAQQDLVLYKMASPTVTFDANGGTGTMASQTASTPTALNTNTFTRSGFTFNGWNTVANGSGTAYANGASYLFSASATLYAQWLSSCTPPGNPTGSISAAANPACGNTMLNYSASSANIYWQTSATGTSTANATTSSYPVSTSGTYYVRAYNGNCWSTSVLASSVITVNPAVSIDTDPTNQSTTTGGSATFNTTASGAAGYQWQINTGAGWNNIASATSATYTVSSATLAMNGYQYRVILSGNTPCSDAASASATLNVTTGPCMETDFPSATIPAGWGGNSINASTIAHYASAPNTRQITSSQELISAPVDNPVSINFYVDASGSGGQTGTLAYRIASGAWNTIGTFTGSTAGNTETFDLSTLTSYTSVSFRWTSNTNSIYVDDIKVFCGTPSPTIITSTTSLNASMCGSSTVTASYTVSGSNLTNNILITPPSNAELSLNNSSWQSTPLALIPSSGTVSNTTIYVRTYTPMSAQDITHSSTGTASVNVAFTTTTVAASTPTVSVSALPISICAGSPTTLTATVSNAGGSTVAYQWSIGGSDISGATSSTLTQSLPINTTYTCTVTFTGGCVSSITASGSASIPVLALPAAPSLPTFTYACNNSMASTVISVEGSIYWQSNATGTSETTAASSPRNFTTAGTYYLRSKNVAGCWSAATTVNVTITGLAITAAPINQGVAENGSATFTVTAPGATGYQWQENTGSTWNNIGGATSASYTIASAPLSMNGYQYRVIVNGTAPCITVTSAAATLTVSTYQNGDYRTIGSGTWTSNTASPAIWQRYTSGSWTTSNSPNFNTANNVHIDSAHTITTSGSFGNSINLHVKGTFSFTSSATTASIHVYNGATLNIGGAMTNNGNFIIDDNATVVLNHRSTNLWNGVESFAGESVFRVTYCRDDEELFTPETIITNHSVTGAKFGHLILAPTTIVGGGNWTYILPASGTYQLTAQDFTLNNTVSNNFTLNGGSVTIGRDFIVNPTSTGAIATQSQTGTKSITVLGNFVKNGAGLFRLNGSGNFTFNIKGNTSINEGIFNTLSVISASVYSTVILEGALTVSPGATFTSTTGTTNIHNPIIRFAGAANQNVQLNGTYNLFNVDLAKTGGLANLQTNMLVKNSLTMTSGNLQTNAFTLELGENTTNKGILTYTAGHIIGKMKRWFSGTNTGVTGLFPLGTTTSDRFVTVEYASSPSTGGDLTAQFIATTMGTSGLPQSIVAAGTCTAFSADATINDGYWQMDNGALVGGTYNITMVGENFGGIVDLCKLTALKRVGSSPWTQSGTHISTSGTTTRPVVTRTGASGWSNWGFGTVMITPLPVKLISFNANCENGMVEVDWSTASELNSERFIVESSTDLQFFNYVQEISAAGNSNEVRKYHTSIPRSEGTTYFRLRQEDFDGAYEYFGPISVSCIENSLWNVYVNNGQLHISADEVLSSEYILYVMDMNGKNLLSENITTNTKSIHQTTDISMLNSGIYLVAIRSKDEVKTYKVIIAH